MRLAVFDSPEQVAEAAAERIAACVAAKPSAVLGLATGATMDGVYRALAARLRSGALSLHEATTFNLDEYIGLAPEDPACYRATMTRLLFRYCDLDPARRHLPRGDAADPEAEATRYEAAIAGAGGLDLQLLGLGRNAHVGFNEPGSPADSRTRVVRLCETTRSVNRAHFPRGRDVPERAITLGIATILEARALLLVAIGAVKRAPLQRMLEGPPSPDCPASLLLRHPDLTILADRAAAGGESGAP